MNKPNSRNKQDQKKLTIKDKLVDNNNEKNNNEELPVKDGAMPNTFPNVVSILQGM